ncbi:hypothetical protein GPALN_015055 [Globodera pallida]|nr:hypothetical protein GPALN_015055 [Globodera pallida]
MSVRPAKGMEADNMGSTSMRPSCAGETDRVSAGRRGTEFRQLTPQGGLSKDSRGHLNVVWRSSNRRTQDAGETKAPTAGNKGARQAKGKAV